jgi:hypothetical protein
MGWIVIAALAALATGIVRGISWAFEMPESKGHGAYELSAYGAQRDAYYRHR